jgi:thiol:disulfide interchange protein
MRAAKWAAVIALSVVAFGCGRKAADPPKASEVGTARIGWMSDYQQAAARARELKKPLMVELMADWCDSCKRLEEEVFSQAEVAAGAGKFVPVKVDGDKQPEIKKQLDVSGYPTVVFLSVEGKELGRVRGPVPPQLMVKAMEEAAGKAGAGK